MAFGDIIASWVAPVPEAFGIGFDGSKFYLTDRTIDVVVVVDRQFIEIKRYTSPPVPNAPNCICFAGSEPIMIAGGNWDLYYCDREFNVKNTFAVDGQYGLTSVGSMHFISDWTNDNGDFIGPRGRILKTIPLPAGPTGVAFYGRLGQAKSLLVITHVGGNLYEIDYDGNIINSGAHGVGNLYGLCTDGVYAYMAERFPTRIYKLSLG